MLGIHQSLAMVVGPEFELQRPEAAEYATAICDVAKHYPIRGLDEKTIAWFNLSQIMIIGYGSRIMMIRARWKREAQGARPQQAPPQPRTMPPAASAQASTQQPPASNGSQPGGPVTKGIIPGVGEIDLPPDHPLNPNAPRRH